MSDEQICLPKEGIVPKPTYALLLEDALFATDVNQDEIQLVDLIAEILHR
jgi:hypothetical protein